MLTIPFLSKQAVSLTTDMALEMIQKNEQQFMQSLQDGDVQETGDYTMTGRALHHCV